MSEFTSGNVPGSRQKTESAESQVWWSGRGGQNQIATLPITLDATTVDPGNTPTTTIRAGNLVAIEEATGKVKLYNPDANNGLQVAVGLLEKTQDMLVDGVAAPRMTQMIVSGLLKEGEIHNLDPRAKTQLAGRFVFDSDPNASAPAMMSPRCVCRKSSHYTVTAADNGKMFIATNIVNFSLPAKQNGLTFRFLQSTNSVMAIVSPNDIIYKGNASASSVVFTTSLEKIGSQVLVECMYVTPGQLKWVVSNLGGTTATVA